MNYKKIITSVLLVSDGPVNHAYFCDNFEISKKNDLIFIGGSTFVVAEIL